VEINTQKNFMKETEDFLKLKERENPVFILPHEKI
jgi:hypothetical protein